MPLFFTNEAVDKKLSKKTTVIPNFIRNLALQTKAKYGNNKTQDGYKTINRLLDSSYNQGKKNKEGISAKNNDNAPKKDNNDNLVKFPTSAARKMIGDLGKEKNFIDSQTKNTIINYLKSDVKSKESAVKDNNIVPKVPKIAKTPDIQKQTKPQTITKGNTNVTIHENKKTKTIIINENQLLFLKRK